MSKARVYADINVLRPKEYWDYESFTIQSGDQDEYKVLRKVRGGKYNEVFEGINLNTNERCIIKILKAVKKKKRERLTGLVEDGVPPGNLSRRHHFDIDVIASSRIREDDQYYSSSSENYWTKRHYQQRLGWPW